MKLPARLPRIALQHLLVLAQQIPIRLTGRGQMMRSNLFKVRLLRYPLDRLLDRHQHRMTLTLVFLGGHGCIQWRASLEITTEDLSLQSDQCPEPTFTPVSSVLSEAQSTAISSVPSIETSPEEQPDQDDVDEHPPPTPEKLFLTP